MLGQKQLQKQSLKILPQQIQLLNIFFLGTLDLEQRIQQEIEENPLLEAQEESTETIEDISHGDEPNDFSDWDEFKYDDIPDYKTEYNNYLSDEDIPHVPIKAVEHFKEDLKKQLGYIGLNSEDRQMAEYLIDCLTSRGLMDKPLDEVSEDYSFATGLIVEQAEVLRVLEEIQQLEPVGIAATSIQECLLLQLKRADKSLPYISQALKLVEKHYKDLMHRQFEHIQSSMHIDEDTLKKLLNVISNYRFYPVTESEEVSQPINTIVPDFIVKLEGDQLRVSLYSNKSNSVYVNNNLFEEWSAECTKSDKTATQYLRAKMQNAQWFVSAIKQREETMFNIMKCIVMLQEAYFKEGDIRLLKPMVLRNIADLTGYDISTVSRITSNKYAETHFGIVFMKNLFSEGIANKKGNVISSKVIQSVIAEAIETENKKSPYTDQQLVKILADKGYNIARRTVAKYREALSIPIAQIRAICN